MFSPNHVDPNWLKIIKKKILQNKKQNKSPQTSKKNKPVPVSNCILI